MTCLHALALIVLMEAENQNISAKLETARTALTIAKLENSTVCNIVRKKNLYSWNWDGKQTKRDKESKENLKEIKSLLVKYNPKPSGRRYMNNCNLGKRFKTGYRMIKHGKLCFY